MKILKQFHIDKSKVLSTPRAPHLILNSQQILKTYAKKEDMTKVSYASTVGSLIYDMVCTRSDLAYAVGVVSRFLSNSGREHWNNVKRILRHLLGTSDLNITFGGKKKLLVSYTDSNMYGDIVSSKSTLGYLATFVDEDVA